MPILCWRPPSQRRAHSRHKDRRSTCAGAVLASSSWLDRPCFCCMVRQKICCMPLDTTDIAAMTVPSTLFSISRSVMVLQVHARNPNVILE